MRVDTVQLRFVRVNLGAAFLGKRAALSSSLKFVLCEKRDSPTCY